MIQSVIFSKDKWTVERAKKWLEKHGYKHPKTHITEKYIRFRQYTPKKSEKYRTITFGKGIKAIEGI